MTFSVLPNFIKFALIKILWLNFAEKRYRNSTLVPPTRNIQILEKRTNIFYRFLIFPFTFHLVSASNISTYNLIWLLSRLLVWIAILLPLIDLFLDQILKSCQTFGASLHLFIQHHRRWDVSSKLKFIMNNHGVAADLGVGLEVDKVADHFNSY